MQKLDRIYLGSFQEVVFPFIRKYKFTKDFSWGFYCTASKTQAEFNASIYKTPVVNVYELTNIELLNTKKFDDYSDEWLDFIIGCRNGYIHDYDIVIGPIADDTIYDYIDAYYVGKMNKEHFFDCMKLKYPSFQVSFHTAKALDSVNFIESYQLSN